MHLNLREIAALCFMLSAILGFLILVGKTVIKPMFGALRSAIDVLNDLKGEPERVTATGEIIPARPSLMTRVTRIESKQDQHMREHEEQIRMNAGVRRR